MRILPGAPNCDRAVSRFRTPDGFRLLPGCFSPETQARLVEAVLAGVAASPLYQPAMPRTGRPVRGSMIWA